MRRRFLALVMSLLVLTSTVFTEVTVLAEDKDTDEYSVEYYDGDESEGDKTGTDPAENDTIINDHTVLLLLGSPQSEPANISGTFSCEVGETVSILSVLNSVDDTNDRSITYLRVYSADGSGIVPVVNKNNNEYTYSVGNLSVVAKCGKGDKQKLFTDFACTPSQAGTQSAYIELVKDGDVIAAGTVTLDVPYRVHDDDIRVAPGGTVSVNGNDYVTSKAKIILCDASGTPLTALTADDGVTVYYEPAAGLKVTNDGSQLTVLEDSSIGAYTLWYYAQEPGKNGRKFYTDDNGVPAEVALRVTAASLYSLTDDRAETMTDEIASVNILENDILPAVDFSDLDVRFYDGNSVNPFAYELDLIPQADGTLRPNWWPVGFVYHPDTGVLDYTSDYPSEFAFGYRVFFSDDEYIEAVVNFSFFGVNDIYVGKPIPYGVENTIDLLNSRSILPDEPYTISLCNADGSTFTAPSGITADINDSNQLVITADEPGMDIELYYKLECSYGTNIARITLQSDYMAMPDKADAPLGVEVSLNVLDNDILPALEDVPGAVSRKVILCTRGWPGPVVIEPDPDGYCYPDRKTETDPNTGDDVTTWSIKVKMDDDGNALATIYRQKKSDFTYAVQYLDDAGNVLTSYEGEATIIPVLNYTRREVVTVPEFSPADIQGYEGDPDSSNKWQVVKGDYYGDDYSVSADDGVVIEKNVAATDTENLFDVILDIKTPVFWSEFLELGTCRLQNGNSDNSSNRVLLYSTMEEAEAIKQFYTDTGSPDTEIVTVQVLFYHDDWQNTDNIVHTATKYVVKPSNGNYYFYYEDPAPDHNLHSEKDQSRKIADGNFYYVDITKLYEDYSFAVSSVVPNTVTDPMGDMINFKDFVYNPSDSASYADGILTWNVASLYKGALEDLIEVTVDGRTMYMHQYNLIYSVELDTAAQGFVSMSPYDTNKRTTFEYTQDGTKYLDFNIPQVQGRLQGDLTVSKTISGNGADGSREFSFTVTLGDNSVNGVYGDMTFTNGVASFTLKGGENKTATGLPDGASYTVAEEDYSAEGYTTTKSGDTGTITGGQTVTAAFTNTKNTTPTPPPAGPEAGSLKISKTVTGDLGDKTKYFTFKIKFNTDGMFSYSGSKSGSIGNGGTIKLKHGESITITNIPAGTSYSVTESGNRGYSVYASGNTGIIVDGKTSIAKFTNNRSSVPKTGDDSNMTLWLSLMVIAVIGMIGTLFIENKKRRKAV